MRINPSHKWVAGKTGHSIAAISLFRRGLRPPTLDAMTRFDETFGWPMCDQLEARSKGTWADGLNACLSRAAELEDV